MILITGGTGFLGSTLIKQLIDQGIDVIATKRAQSIIPASLLSSSLIQWIDADINDYFELEDALEGVTKVYHCAALVSYQKKDAKSLFKVNVEGTANIVNLCLEKNIRLLHVSSIAALGTNKDNLPVSEKDHWEHSPTTSNYSLSKYQAEMEVWRGITEGLDAVIVNPSVILGAAAKDKGSGAIFSMINKGLKFYPKGSVGIVDVVDVASIMIQLMEKGEITAERYIINHLNIPNRDLLSVASVLMNKPEPTIEVSETLLQIASTVSSMLAVFKKSDSSLTKETAAASSAKLQYSNAKVQSLLNHSYRPLEQTLKEIANLYSKQ